jgi:hypothetical protein
MEGMVLAGSAGVSHALPAKLAKEQKRALQH